MNIANLSQSSFKEFAGNNKFFKNIQKLELNNNQTHQNNILDKRLHHNDDISMTPETQQNSILIKNAKQICQNQLKEKLIQLFRRDKLKNHEMCDYFMNDLGLGEHCDNIEHLIHYIMENDAQPINKNTFEKYLKYQKDKSSIQTQEITGNLRISNKKLSIFPENINFITSTFSRDKVQILLQLHGTNHKILNFLNFLLISLRSFIYTNEKQWILMKDEVERYLSKYEHNVEKIYQIEDEDEEDENFPINANNNTGNRLQLGGVKLQKTKQIKKISQEVKRKFNNKLTLDHYKAQTSKVRKKLAEHQQTMCSALRKSCYVNYEKFKEIVSQLRDGMIFVMGLIDKTERFKQSKEKYLIREFLLESRKVGVESLILLQQIYKQIVERLEQTRRRISMDVEDTPRRNEAQGKRQEEMGVQTYEPKNSKQRGFVRQVERVFEIVESMLLVKKTKSILLLSRRQQQKVIELDDRKSSQQDSSSYMIQQMKKFEEQQQKQALKALQSNPPVIVIEEQQKMMKIAQQSENEKFISSVIQQDHIQSSSSHHENLMIQALQKQQTQILGKEKKIKKKVKKEQEKQQKVQQLIEEKVQIKKKRGRKPKIQQQQLQQKQQDQHKQQKELSIINSEDEHNQSSSSLQYLSHGAKQTLKETKKQADQNKSKQHSNSMNQSSTMKNNAETNKIDDLESISLSIPLSLHYEQQAGNMDEFGSQSECKDSDSCRYESMVMESNSSESNEDKRYSN